MELKEIQEELKICEIQDNLTEKQRKDKRAIFSTAKNKLDGDAVYRKYKNEVINCAEILKNATKGAFELDSSVQVNEYKLRELINKCGDREEYRNIVKCATSLCQSLSNLSNIEKQTVLMVVAGLDSLFECSLFGKEIQDEINIQKKNAEEVYDGLSFDKVANERLRVLSKVEQMAGDLGVVAAEYTHELVDYVFYYYMYGNKELYDDNKYKLEPEPEIRQKIG